MLVCVSDLAFVAVVANALSFFEQGSASLVCLYSRFLSCPPSHRLSLLLLPVFILTNVLAVSAASFSLRLGS